MSALRTRAVIGGTFLAVVAPVLLTGTAQAAAPTDCDDFNAEVTQIIRPRNDANLITRSELEVQSAKAYGFTDNKGVLAKVALGPATGLTPVWRLYRSGDFVWASDGAEAQSFVDDGYNKQFVEFYAATDDNSCLDPIQRLERNGIHRLADDAESKRLVADGWRLQDAAFYALTKEQTDPEPPPAEPGGDTKFSIAVIPDTQNESNSTLDPRFSNRNSWLIENKKSKDLRYAMQIGDLSNWGNVVPAQFEKMSNELKPLEAEMGYAGAIGNHDTAAVCVGGSACIGQSASLNVRNTTAFNKYFPVSRFPNVKGTFENNKIDNAYATFRAGEVDWLVLTLELWPRQSAINWAKEVVESHPDHNVIVVTHAYLEADGSISTSNGGYGATSPRYLFDNLIKVYPNVKLVLSGHVGQGAVRTDQGAGGNTVVSMLQGFHSPTNPVRVVEIDTAAGTMTSEVYAPLAKTSYPQYASSTTGLTFER